MATGVHIVGSATATSSAPRVHVAGTEPIAIDLADALERYASERHNPGNAPRRARRSRSRPGSPLLAGGLELVDTPGVDSVVARHADVTLAALALADALVLVVDPVPAADRPRARLPRRRPPSAFGHVVFVLTRVWTCTASGDGCSTTTAP